jgi:hypothetical protein
MLNLFNTSLQQAQHQLEEGSPLPYEQNDDLSDGGASSADGGASGVNTSAVKPPKKRGRGKNYGDEVIEITPEMYGLTQVEEAGKWKTIQYMYTVCKSKHPILFHSLVSSGNCINFSRWE